MILDPIGSFARPASLAHLLPMTWSEVCAHPDLQRLPYRIELNARNKIEVSEIEAHHESGRETISQLLSRLKPAGTTLLKFALQTADNIKVPDVGWISAARKAVAATPEGVFTDAAPDICVELYSPRNMLAEKLHKGQLYLQAGALEFWLCNELGDLRFFDASGPLEHSRLCPNFPTKIEFHR